jgi:hypothetical protein
VCACVCTHVCVWQLFCFKYQFICVTLARMVQWHHTVKRFQYMKNVRTASVVTLWNRQTDRQTARTEGPALLNTLQLFYLHSTVSHNTNLIINNISVCHTFRYNNHAEASIVTGLWARQSGFQLLVGSRGQSVLKMYGSALGPTPPMIQWVLESSFPGLQQPRCEAGHSRPSSAKVKNEWSYNSTAPIILSGVSRDNLTPLLRATPTMHRTPFLGPSVAVWS